MSCETGHVHICNLVRSGVVLVVGLPVALSLGGLTSTFTRVVEQNAANPAASVLAPLRAKLAKPCLDYRISPADSKLERNAKNEIDEIMGGEVNYNAICQWAK